MTLHQNKTMHPPGFPELGAAVLLAITIFLALKWVQSDSDTVRWKEVEGNVVSAELRDSHYNATESRTRVDLTYEYEVEGRKYQQSWIGFWPLGNSPNALGVDGIKQLSVKGFPLFVFYDPANPNVSRLHELPFGTRWLYGAGAGIALLLSFGYCAFVYPSWKRWRAYYKKVR